MDRVIPWPELTAAVQTAYPQVSQSGGRPPIPLERMLRIYFLQLWFNPSDSAVEQALYDSVSMRGFVGIDLGVESVPDETTVCKFRHLLERNKLGKTVLRAVNEHLHRGGIKIAKGTIVDATIIGAPSSTKNQDKKRDLEMRQTAKGQQWYFGMKAHVGVDSRTKLIHTVLASAANVHDREALPYLLHGKETRVWGDQGCQGQTASRCTRGWRRGPTTARRSSGGAATSPGQLSLAAQGQVRYTLKTPYQDGTTRVVLEPLDFIAQLAAPHLRLEGGCKPGASTHDATSSSSQC